MSFVPPPRDLSIALYNWLALEIYPGFVGHPLDTEGVIAWLVDRWPALWQTLEGTPLEKLQRAKEQIYREIDAIVRPQPVSPPPVSNVRPLQGQLRVQGRSYADATGPRQVRFCSWFPAIRIFRDQRDRFLRQLDECARYWQGVRIFAAVGAPPYWSGREVLPSWPNYDELVAGVLGEFKARGLKAHLTTGDMQVLFPGGTGELAFQQRLGGIVNRVGPDVVGVHECWNEGWQNNAYGDDAERAKALSAAFAAICPQPLRGLSAPPTNEEPDGLIRWSQDPATVGMLHGTRTADDCTRRAFNSRYETPIAKPIWQGEPTGPNSGRSSDVYQPVNDRDVLFGLYLMHIICGQASTYFNSPSIRYNDGETLGDAWGFTELCALQNLLPEDIGQWPNLSHGNKGSVPFSSREFSDVTGAGPARVDGAWSDRQGAWLVYGGAGGWPLFSRRAMRYRVVSHQGVQSGGRVSAGQDLPGLNASMKVRLILGDFE